MPTEQEVFEALKPIVDPELNLSIVDLGLIYGVKIEEEGKRVVVDMTLTSIACPVGPQLRAAVHAAAAGLPGVADVYVNLLFNPPWNPRTMASDDVLLHLGLG
ncbi:MAG TPA: metal-sulfur cluster assembly factor [bacterium]|jgi:metal-sulfur cluster biosynthetic enzyme|nr:metal-sulfur cluster assembly factor [bacterium]